MSAAPTGALDNPATRIEFAAKGRIEGIVVPEGVAVPPELGRDIDWSLAGNAARDGSAVDLTRLSAEAPGAALTGAGQLTEGGRDRGSPAVSIADLRPFSGLAGHPLAGSLELEANAAREGACRVHRRRSQGSAKELRTGIAAGGRAARRRGDDHRLLERDAAGVLIVDRLAVAGAAVSLSGDGRFDPASNALAAALALELPRLKPLGAALGTEMAGAVSAQLDAEGRARSTCGSKGEIEGTTSRPAGQSSTGCGSRASRGPRRTKRRR